MFDRTIRLAVRSRHDGHRIARRIWGAAMLALRGCEKATWRLYRHESQYLDFHLPGQTTAGDDNRR
jgi:hypothetical protein